MNVFEKSFHISGHMAMFIQYFNSTIFSQFIGQGILPPPFYRSKKVEFLTILEMETISCLINNIMWRTLSLN